MSFYRLNEQKHQIELSVKALPNSSKNEIVGQVENTLKIKLKAPPVDGEANMELIAFVAKWLKLSKAEVVIQKGSASKSKKLLLPANEDIVKKLALFE